MWLAYSFLHQVHIEAGPESLHGACPAFFSLLWVLILKFARGTSHGRRQVASFALGGYGIQFLMLPCSLFWQVNRIEEMTSVIPSMLTTACWIQRPMNAGRSLLLTHSGTIGTASIWFRTKLVPNSYQNPMETRKLICFACHHIHLNEAEMLSLLKRLPQLRSDFSISYFYLKNPCTICCVLFHRMPILF